MRTARVVAAAVAVLAALGVVSLAARSGRTETVTAVTTPTVTPPASPPSRGPSRQAEREEAPGSDTSGGEMPDLLVAIVLALLLGLAAVALRAVLSAARPGPVRSPGRGPPAAPPSPADDTAAATARLAAAVDAGLRELEDGDPGDGVVACWVRLERAAEDAGTARERPETPSELAGKLIDRHDVAPAPLLRLADLYREARYSRHVLPESARAEARGLLEQVRADLAASR